MQLRTFRAWKNSTAVAVLSACASLVSCSGAGQPTDHPHAATPQDYGPVQVSERARKPTDVKAGGIDVTSRAKEISFSFGPNGSNRVVIPYNDWNTITATSGVPIDVGLMLDPGFNADDTIRNRFQYLADRISRFESPAFNVIGVDSSPAYGKYMATIAVYNPTDQVREISHLRVKISRHSPNATLASQLFYDASHSGCIVPAHTIYFAYLGFPKTATASNSASFSLSYDTGACPGQVCPAGTPISLCQE